MPKSIPLAFSKIPLNTRCFFPPMDWFSGKKTLLLTVMKFPCCNHGKITLETMVKLRSKFSLVRPAVKIKSKGFYENQTTVIYSCIKKPVCYYRLLCKMYGGYLPFDFFSNAGL